MLWLIMIDSLGISVKSIECNDENAVSNSLVFLCVFL